MISFLDSTDCGFLSAIDKNMYPKMKNAASDPTAILILPPGITVIIEMTKLPNAEAPLENISYIPKYSPEFSSGMILE